MHTHVDIPALERPAFFDGQRLTATDLAAVQTFHRELRWLHNRSMHAWGIALGLQVAGQRGERVVTVQPGYALDCQGRELILSQPQTMAVPAVARARSGGPATYYLTASYAADEDLQVSETRTGVCQGTGAVRRLEAPLLRWQDPTDTAPESRYRHGLDVILATIQVQNCQLAAPVSLAERREARPAQQPYVAAGSTPEGKTSWSFWPAPERAFGVQTTVDTSTACFGATPDYMAHLVGSRVLSEPSVGEEFLTGQLVDGFTHILHPTPTRFVLQMLMPRNLPLPGYTLNPDESFAHETLDKLRIELKWHVVWMGVEG